ncbi:hypothetical protein EX30DRAFT_341237 [Ascodesmis nigricans]|uniref:Nucleoside transporter family n=1 Tax=Ascodesmis nigricans TaxID=341454 RepID=A0A4S2MWB3_9PEZI|nr:hypothetical protein EX30DRAFT_341237 [Ascodesmis nigricans]
MFMACATYFQSRFQSDEWISNNFQSLILVVSTVTNLLIMLDLQNRQSGANYPFRICTSLVLNCVIFVLLSVSTLWFICPAVPYLVFTLICVLLASASSGFSQNGVFAFVSRFGGGYTQAVMTGQGIAGVLPAVAQIASVLAVPHQPATSDDNGDASISSASPTSAFVYFLTATAVSGICLVFFLLLLQRHNIPLFSTPDSKDVTEDSAAQVPFSTLFGKLKWLCFAIWLDFCITMTFPVFTQAITSNHPLTPETSRIWTPEVFIPLGFFLWNFGDLCGRISCGFSLFTVTNPKILAAASTLRILFIPLYYMCNFKGQGAVIQSDLFYWLIQLGFGFTNGWIGSNCMMAAPEYVEEDEKEACGGFMGMWLVFGLASGSLMSFALGA